MKKFGIIGMPLGHSFSPGYFNEKFQNENIDAIYEKHELKNIADLVELLEEEQELCGLNVTIPYKEKVMEYLDYVSPEARSVGAVNVIKVSHDTESTVEGLKRKVTRKKYYTEGYNSDVFGFMNSIKPFLSSYHKKALILGTGGASKAINYSLRNLGLETLFVSRTVRDEMITYEQITPEMLEEYLVIVNCTPCGMSPHYNECPKLPYEALTSRHILYDLIYNPDETLFLKKGKAQGAMTKNGLEMLLLQADESWRIWNDTKRKS
jgi:shikimate dehydrogenase